VTFSSIRVGKRIIWEQSKRLISGSLVALLPKNDLNKVIVAVVAARPLSKLIENPPGLYLFCDSLELDIDPAKEYLMVESRSSYFEADRHVLRGLQHMASESFPFQEHLIGVQTQVHTIQHSALDVSPVYGNGYQHVLTWPTNVTCEMDGSQQAGLCRIVTKRLAIIQGPPGTGKTYVSVEALKVLLANWRPGDPPIIILAQTNHALDQLARHVLEFEPELVRIGGQSKDEIVKKRTLFEVSQQHDGRNPPGCQLNMARRKMEALQKEITSLLSPLQQSAFPLDLELLGPQGLSLLSKNQIESLIIGAARWGHSTPFALWLGDSLKPVAKQPAEQFEFEEAELEVDNLNEAEKEAAIDENDKFETLEGPELPVHDNFTCPRISGVSGRTSPTQLLKVDDLWEISDAQRPAVYRHMQAQMKAHVFQQFQIKAQTYNKLARLCKIGRWERQENVLKEQKVIAMTTTGFSKNRALINALQPRIILCEEAAEVLEAPIAVTCVPSLKQLILVGDHAQLRPHTQYRKLENEPHYLNISLFERLVNNQVEFTTLKMQRRMIPEIRRLLMPIYENKIRDHVSVTESANRPQVRGMGGINSFCFSHKWPEARDELMSSFNASESSMIRGFVEYLFLNGETQITCLTFYNGQRKALVKDFRSSKILHDYMPKVVTVDSYQGEENDIVILSLVRSNNKKQVGFLDNANRVCVALSRARRGFYLFGNCGLLFDASDIWRQIVSIIAGHMGDEKPKLRPNRLGKKFPVFCEAHHVEKLIAEAEDWNNLQGGCQQPCGASLACGHICSRLCHPCPHDVISCVQCPRGAIKMASRTPSPTKFTPLRSPIPHPVAHGHRPSQSSVTSWQDLEGLKLTSTNSSNASSTVLVEIDDVEASAPAFHPREVSPTSKGFGGRPRVVETFQITRGGGSSVDQSRQPSLLDD
jgi:helicase required for RNAi-mediated heterochromatin assembly 1